MSEANSTTEVEYRPIPGFEGIYRVGDDGTIWSRRRRGTRVLHDWRKMAEKYATTGRVFADLSVGDGTIKRVWVHRLVLEVFVGPCPDGMECAHYDGKCTNNRVDNLRWATHRDNLSDQIRHGTRSAVGERNNRSKITALEAIAIRREVMSLAESLAKKHNLNPFYILQIASGRTWKHLKMT
jgi:hypothetical protein